VHLHPFYQKQFGTRYGLCPIAENAYEEIISLPIHSKLTNDDTYYIVDSIKEIMRE
jgi:perosamine synthetase